MIKRYIAFIVAVFIVIVGSSYLCFADVIDIGDPPLEGDTGGDPVEEEPLIVNSTRDISYTSLLTALDEAEDGDTLTLLRNVEDFTEEAKEPIILDKGYTITLTGRNLTDAEKIEGLSPDWLIPNPKIELKTGSNLILGTNLAFSGDFYVQSSSYLTVGSTMLYDVYIEDRQPYDGPAIRNSGSVIGRYITIHPYPGREKADYTKTRFVGYTDIDLFNDGTDVYKCLTPVDKQWWKLDAVWADVPYDWKSYNEHIEGTSGQDQHWISIANYSAILIYREANLSTSDEATYNEVEYEIADKLIAGSKYTFPKNLPSRSDSYIELEWSGYFYNQDNPSFTKEAGVSTTFPEGLEENIIWVAEYKPLGTKSLHFENAELGLTPSRPEKTINGKKLNWLTTEAQASFATLVGGYSPDTVIKYSDRKFMNEYMTTTADGWLFSHFEVYTRAGNKVIVDGKPLVWDPYTWNTSTGKWEADPNPYEVSGTTSFDASLLINSDLLFKAFYVRDSNNDNIPDVLQPTANFLVTPSLIKSNVDSSIVKMPSGEFDKASINAWATANNYIFDETAAPKVVNGESWYKIGVLVDPTNNSAVITVPHIAFNVGPGVDPPKYTNWVIKGEEDKVYPFDAQISTNTSADVYLYPYYKAAIYNLTFGGDFNYLKNPPEQREIGEGSPLIFIELAKINLGSDGGLGSVAAWETRDNTSVNPNKWYITTSTPITIKGVTKSKWTRDELYASGYIGDGTFIQDRSGYTPLIDEVKSNIRVTLTFEAETAVHHAVGGNFKAGTKS